MLQRFWHGLWLQGPSFLRDSLRGGQSIEVRDQKILQEFLAGPENTFLVSFPRTGSHWLRMVMELYFEKAILPRIFFAFSGREFLAYHTHDMDLAIRRERVVYLYRHPADTVYSQLRYGGESLDREERVRYWGRRYSEHLCKWLHTEDFTKQKTIIKYERLKTEFLREFAKVARHFGEELDQESASQIVQRVTRSGVKERTGHDPRVLQRGAEYEQKREEFRERYGHTLLGIVREECPMLPHHEF